MSGELFKVPLFVKANSRQNLIRAMVVNNQKHGVAFNYFQITKEGKDYVAWYLGDALKEFKDEVNDSLSSENRRRS